MDRRVVGMECLAGLRTGGVMCGVLAFYGFRGFMQQAWPVFVHVSGYGLLARGLVYFSCCILLRFFDGWASGFGVLQT
jgi:hypothetical protein